MSKFGERTLFSKGTASSFIPCCDHKPVYSFPRHTGSQGLPRMNLTTSKENSTYIGLSNKEVCSLFSRKLRSEMADLIAHVIMTY